MATNLIHGLYLELERVAKARGDKRDAALYRQSIRANQAANTLRRRAGESSALVPTPHALFLPLMIELEEIGR